MSTGLASIKGLWHSAPSDDDYPRGSILRGVGCSFTLHAMVLVALFLGLRLLPTPQLTPAARIILVNLVELGDTNTSPRAEETAELAQQQAAEHATVSASAAIPMPQSPPAPRVLRPADPHAATRATDARADTATPTRSLQPTDSLSARLEQLAQLRQPAPAQAPAPREQEGQGLSNRTVAGANAVPGDTAVYRVKDFLRAQIERRWNIDVQALKSTGVTASIHLTLESDGSIMRAEIVADPKHVNDPVYDAFARSARNAALLSSPLTLLPGSYAIAKDIVIDFDARRLLR